MLLAALLGLALAADPPTVEAALGKGIAITSADDRFSMRISARLQVRGLFDYGPVNADERKLTSLAQIRTFRLTLSGHVLSRDVSYKVTLALGEADYRDSARSPMLDAYVDLTPSRDASVRAGQMFIPFDRARTTKESALQFADRQIPVTELNLDRSIGTYLYSDHFLGDASMLAYKVGVFAPNGLNLILPQPPGAVFVGRLELRPLGEIDDDSEGDQKRRKEPGLAIGVAGAYSLNSSRVRSVTGATFADDTVDYLHLDADVVFKWYGFSVLAEALSRTSPTDVKVSDAGDARYTRSAWGWFVQPSYAFTKNFELAGRYSDLLPLDGTDPDMNHTHETGAAFNIYLNGHAFKVGFDWVAEWTDDDFSAAGHKWHVLTDITF